MQARGVQKLLEQYKKFFGWDLTSAQIDTWTKKMQGTSSTIGEQQIRAFVEGRALAVDVPSDPISQEALLKLADADDWYADMRTGDPDADKLLLRVHTAQRLRDLSFSEANDALRRAFMKNDSRLTEHVSREDFRAALASCRVAEALDSLDVNTRNGALKFFSDSTSFSGANNVNYGLFLKTLRRAWLTRPPPGASGSMTGSRKLDAQLAIVKKKLRESATKQLKDKSALMPLTVFRRLDTNGDGRIEPKEFHEGLTQLGINVDMPLEDIKKLIAFFDDDEDGTMDAYEFLEFVLKGTVGYKAGGSGRRGAAPEGKSRATPGVPAIGGGATTTRTSSTRTIRSTTTTPSPRRAARSVASGTTPKTSSACASTCAARTSRQRHAQSASSCASCAPRASPASSRTRRSPSSSPRSTRRATTGSTTGSSFAA